MPTDPEFCSVKSPRMSRAVTKLILCLHGRKAARSSAEIGLLSLRHRESWVQSLDIDIDKLTPSVDLLHLLPRSEIAKINVSNM